LLHRDSDITINDGFNDNGEKATDHGLVSMPSLVEIERDVVAKEIPVTNSFEVAKEPA